MKNMIIEIKTAYCNEKYFLPVNKNKSIEVQIDMALADYGYCDAYEIIAYKEVTEEYIKERNKIIVEYEEKYEPIEDAFCCGTLATLESIKEDMKWRESL